MGSIFLQRPLRMFERSGRRIISVLLVTFVMAGACATERRLAEDHGFAAMSKWGRPSDEWVWRCVIDTLSKHPDRLPTADEGFELAPPQEPAQFKARSTQSFLIRTPSRVYRVGMGGGVQLMYSQWTEQVPVDLDPHVCDRSRRALFGGE